MEMSKMETMTTQEMKRSYNVLTKKEKSLTKEIKDYQFLINSLLVELRGLGEKLHVSFTRETLLRFHKEKSKLEADLVSIRLDKGVLNAKLKSIFSRLRESNSVQEIFSSLNEKYGNYAIPLQFEYEYDSSIDDVKNVTIYKKNLKEM
jgi:hypothetical protein